MDAIDQGKQKLILVQHELLIFTITPQQHHTDIQVIQIIIIIYTARQNDFLYSPHSVPADLQIRLNKYRLK